jgi:hypothetical protein
MNSALTTRVEGVALRPFTGLDALEAFAESQITLEITANSGRFSLLHGDTCTIPANDFASSGISVQIKDPDQLRKLVDPLVMKDWSDVALFIETADRPSSILKEKAVVFKDLLPHCPAEITLSQPGLGPDERILQNKFTGYRISVVLVLATSAEKENPLKPRRKGSILARVEFTVRPGLAGDSIQPKPMDEAKKKQLGIPASAWVFFDPKPAFLESEAFEDALDFYVDKEMLDEIQLLPASESKMSQILLYSSLVSALVAETSRVLNEEEDSALTAEQLAGQVLQLIKSKFPNRDIELLLDDLRTSPSRVTTEILSFGNHQKDLMFALKKMNGELDVVSDSDSE